MKTQSLLPNSCPFTHQAPGYDSDDGRKTPTDKNPRIEKIRSDRLISPKRSENPHVISHSPAASSSPSPQNPNNQSTEPAEGAPSLKSDHSRCPFGNTPDRPAK